MNLATFTAKLDVLADTLQEFPKLPARELFDRSVQREIEQSNRRMFQTRGKSVSGRWGSYRGYYSHPLPKNPGETYWLVDKDYSNPNWLRTSLVELRHPKAEVVYRGGRNYRRILWGSKVPYADYVHTRYGIIFALDREAQQRIPIILIRQLKRRLEVAWGAL